MNAFHYEHPLSPFPHVWSQSECDGLMCIYRDRLLIKTMRDLTNYKAVNSNPEDRKRWVFTYAFVEEQTAHIEGYKQQIADLQEQKKGAIAKAEEYRQELTKARSELATLRGQYKDLMVSAGPPQRLAPGHEAPERRVQLERPPQPEDRRPSQRATSSRRTG